MRLARSLLMFVWVYVALVIAGASQAIPLLFARKPAVAALRLWSRLTTFGLRWIVGARIRFEGLEYAPKGGALVAAKHQSMLDTMLPAIALDWPAFAYKQELKNAPIVGWYLQAGGMISIAREEGASALKALLREAKQAIADQRQIVIFPEGTRKMLGEPTDYKSGVAALYLSLKLPCTPVALDTGAVWPARGLMRYPVNATVKFLPPIPAGLSREEFMRELESRIESESAALLARDAPSRVPQNNAQKDS